MLPYATTPLREWCAFCTTTYMPRLTLLLLGDGGVKEECGAGQETCEEQRRQRVAIVVTTSSSSSGLVCRSGRLRRRRRPSNY